MSLRRKLFASLEELPVEGTVSGDEQITESVVAIDDVSRQTMEVNDAAEELDAAEFEQEELGEVAEALESLIADATGSLESGGLDATAAHFAYKAANFALGRIGHQIQVPSAESFGGSASRLKQTTVSVEGWKETLKSIWDAFFATLTKIKNWAIKFYQTKLSQATSLKRRAAAILKRADKEEVGKGEIDVPAKLHIGGKVLDSVDALTEAMGEVSRVNNTMITRVADTNKYMDTLLGQLSAVDFSADDKFESSLAPAIATMNKGIPLPEGGVFSNGEGKEGLTVLESKELPGGKRIRLISSVGKEGSVSDVLTAFDKQAVQIDNVSEAPKEGGKIAALSKDKIKFIAQSISASMENIVKRKTDFDAISAVNDKADSAGKKLSSSSAKAETLNKDNKAAVSKISKVLGKIVKLNNDGVKVVSEYSTTLSAMALDLCDKSFKAKEAKAEEKKDDKAPAAAGA